ncbi:uncharacterized protein GGS22DRAFT_191443 [Annulohypoxylon maeteangense]|uniref:uncharacterized protein n=1 Tax=Annulohypoxylon maeteangense TaxID=1927788 RepID=UPI002007A820|nr:uncharacterized protein GGS22DRAFT_191443 [Annulohypoxylon maeteangense]KAI0882274.1 hypothetical protein GGS22DRAFT_191443 [Annulohypoxylon maeteangense]
MSSQRSGEQSTASPWAYTLYPADAPEFYIYDNHRKNLEGNQEFTITVKRRSEFFGEADYVKIYLLEWDQEGSRGFVHCEQTRLAGTKKKRWNSRRSITFDDLAMVSAGLFRIEVEIWKYCGGQRHDIRLDTLISNDIEFPEIVVE